VSSSATSPTPTADPVGPSLPERLSIGCRFDFELPAALHAVVMVEPHTSEAQRVESARFSVDGGHPSWTYIDAFGNSCRRMSFDEGPQGFTFSAVVRNDAGFDDIDVTASELPPAELPDEALTFLLPSRFCPSDELAPLAASLFGERPRGWRRVDDIAGWANGHLTFAYGSSSPTKTAADAYRDGSGVCRDFAHLAITMCRALNIPARYVVGYLPDIAVPDPGTPMDFCAWTEVFLGDRWFTFDPRNHGQRRVGRTVIGRGRDAADVAMTTTFGHTTLLGMTVVAEPAP
jgi:transglutaminase-like putative cysteine protease